MEGGLRTSRSLHTMDSHPVSQSLPHSPSKCHPLPWDVQYLFVEAVCLLDPGLYSPQLCWVPSKHILAGLHSGQWPYGWFILIPVPCTQRADQRGHCRLSFLAPHAGCPVSSGISLPAPCLSSAHVAGGHVPMALGRLLSARGRLCSLRLLTNYNCG